MKVISLTEATAKVRKYAALCKREAIVVTVNGKPSFRMSPLNDDDTLVEDLIASNPKFRSLLQERMNGKFVSSKASAKWFD